MGIFSWLFPTEKDNIRRARRFIGRGEYAMARLVLEGVTSEEAIELRLHAQERLVDMNIQRARGDMVAGEFDEAAARLNLATEFADGLFNDELRAARRELREARAAARAAGAPKKEQPLRREQSAADARAHQPHSLGPGFKADPLYSLPPDDPRLRYALLLESYPAELRKRSLALGPDYAATVMAMADGDNLGAFHRLGDFVELDPVARFERARAALALGSLAEAVSDLEHLGRTLGHQRIGNMHTAVMLARVLWTVGQITKALDLIASARLREPDDLELAVVHAQLMESQGMLPQADAILVDLQKRAPRDQGVYRLLARVRLKGGDRDAARQALEAGLSNICTTPGKCGSRPPDVDSMRLLARLYLEDRLDEPRALELVQQVASSGAAWDWSDAYLQALLARNRGEPDLASRASALLRDIPSDDPRRRLVREQLGV